MDKLVGSLRKSFPELGDRLTGDVEADEVETTIDEGDVVPPIAATDVETTLRHGIERADSLQDLTDEGDWRFVLVTSSLVLPVPCCFRVVGYSRTLGAAATTSIAQGPSLRRCVPSYFASMRGDQQETQ